MKKAFFWKLISVVLVVATLMTALPVNVLAAALQSEEAEVYIQAVKLAQAETREEAKRILEEEGYIFLEGNLNEGTGEDGIWLGYKTTTDPTKAIYDMKVMNMKGGFTLTGMKEALEEQASAFATMANDLNYLVEEFVEAYNAGSVPAQKAYMALNFFRMVEGETELAEENGLGYQLVRGEVTLAELTEFIMLCDSGIVDSVIKILTMGIQIRNGNWLDKLSKEGPYEEGTVYMEDEAELKRRAEQLLRVLELYSASYNAMEKSGLIPDKLDDNFEPDYGEGGGEQKDGLPAGEADAKKLDESRYKFYKIAVDELQKYRYGTDGTTLKDFFCSLAEEGNAKKLYPLVSVLSDGEFAALSYGCFLEVVTGATATIETFDSYDDVYASITSDVKSVYLYCGVDESLLDEDSVIAFTEEASRHMASTGELEFYEKESAADNAWETGKNIAMIVGGAGLALMGVTKVVMGSVMLIGLASSTVATSLSSGMLAGFMKVCSLMSGLPALGILAAAVLVIVLIALAVFASFSDDDIDWEANPMPEYIYDVKEVSFSQNSDDGIATEHIQRPVYVMYEAVTDVNGKLVDLNAFSNDSLQWLELFVSYDRQGDDAKPIKAEDLLIKTGNGVAPNDYVPLSRFGEVIAYDLNQWDEDDDVNGVYLFYKQDRDVAVDSGRTYYIYDIYLQSGVSDAHCIDLLKSAGYTPLNVNLSPDLDDGEVFGDKVYTYLGYKVTTNPENAIRDIRVEYGQSVAEVKHGAATYAQCGSNGSVSLYATKYKSAGTPVLAGGLICVNDRDDAPTGYEPVNFFAGGPAVSFSVSLYGITPHMTEYFIFFLPETTFTGGTTYLGGIGYLYSKDAALRGPLSYTDGREAVLSYLKEKTGINRSFEIRTSDGQRNVMSMYAFHKLGYHSNHTITYAWEYFYDAVIYYQTNNPYRAIYGFKGTAAENNSTGRLTFEGVGYSQWNVIQWYAPPYIPNERNPASLYLCRWSYNGQGLSTGVELNATLYVSGNPSSTNIYKEWQEKVEDDSVQSLDGEESKEPVYVMKKGMSEMEPLKMSEIVCKVQGGVNLTMNRVTSSSVPVTDVFSNSDDPIEFQNENSNYPFVLYTTQSTEERPYVSGVLAIDKMMLFRASGGADAGLSRDAITDAMMLAQLAGQGATNFIEYRASLTQRTTNVFDWDGQNEINAIKFAYSRTADKELALRDVFLYFNKFSTDSPPKELYRGNTKYTLVCEIPYDLSGYSSAPKPGVYLYGTTESKAGNRIIDVEVSGTPFKEGYETVRSMSGRSIWSEIADYSEKQMNQNPMSWAKSLYEEILGFFRVGDEKTSDLRAGNDYFYIHIKREGDDLRKQEPYIGALYLSKYEYHKPLALEELFDKGADGYIDVDLNEGAGGDYVYLGYSYTADPADAIKEIRAYHQQSHPKTLTDDKGRVFTLVSDLDVNADAGGDYIYLYTTKDSATAKPISSVSVAFKVTTGTGTQKWVDGTSVTATTYCTKQWDSNKDSDLNRWAGGDYIYLMYTTVNSSFTGTQKTPNYGKDKTYTRDEFKNRNPEGAYIGGLYVMDKETIRLEKIANGSLTESSRCVDVSDQEVIDRLKKMGATTVLDTPILVNHTGYFEGNTNKVFIGYSRTDDSSKAIRNIAIKAEILSLAQPAEKTSINGKAYVLVAEAAKKVTELPRAINLIGIQGDKDMLLPKFYLYYSTSTGSDPIYDISIDDLPLVNGWNTVRSANVMDPFADVYQQAYAQYELANKDDWDFYDSEIVYTDELFEWMDDVAELFDPADAEVKPFYIHVKRHTEESLETVRPYIGEVFLAKGESKHEVLSKLIAYEPDGFIDVDLNKSAGGDYVYMAYRRVASEKDALTDIMVYEGQKFEPTRRITVNDKSVKFTLVADIDLNSNAGGKYLYLYSTDSGYTGNPITSLSIGEQTDSYLKCGVERVTVKRAEGSRYTDELVDLNKSAGGDYLYMIMTRATAEGHRSSGVIREFSEAPTCGDNGHHTVISGCLDCSAEFEDVTVLKATGDHKDQDGDEDHRCDVCRKRNVSEHVCAETPTEESRREATPEKDGYYYLVYRCTECDEVISETKVIIPAGTPAPAPVTASLFGEGSVLIVCAFAGVAALAAIIAYYKKKQQKETTKHENID